MKFDDVYIVDADISGTEFIRRTYINLARNSYTPKILEGTFGPVETGMMQVAGCVAHVDTSYSYDRITYGPGVVMETEQQAYGDSYREVQVPRAAQVARRTHESGKTSGDVIGCVLNMKSFAAVDNPASYLFYLNYTIPDMERRTKRHADSTYKNLTLSDEAYLRSTQTACAIVNSMAVLPDEYDNITFDPVYYVKQVNCYMVPYYTASYTYGSKTYTAKGFACGEPKVWNTCPDGINNVSVDTIAEKATGVKVVQYLFPVLTWVSYAVAFVLACIYGLDAFLYFFIPLGFYLIGIIAFEAAASRYNKYASRFQPKWQSQMTAALNELFRKLNMKPLTQDETNEFAAVDFVSMHTKTLGYSNISKYSIATVIVLFATLVIAFFITVTTLA